MYKLNIVIKIVNRNWNKKEFKINNKSTVELILISQFILYSFYFSILILDKINWFYKLILTHNQNWKIILRSKGAVKRLLQFIYYLYKQLIALTINWSSSIQSIRHYRLMSCHYHMNRYMSRYHHYRRYRLNYLNCYCLSYCCLNLFHSLMLL